MSWYFASTAKAVASRRQCALRFRFLSYHPVKWRTSSKTSAASLIWLRTTFNMLVALISSTVTEPTFWLCSENIIYGPFRARQKYRSVWPPWPNSCSLSRWQMVFSASRRRGLRLRLRPRLPSLSPYQRSSAPTEQLSSENMLVGMMSTVVENRQGAVSRAASNRCMYKCMMYVYVCQLINFHISTNMHSFIIINRRSFARWSGCHFDDLAAAPLQSGPWSWEISRAVGSRARPGRPDATRG